MSLLLEHFPRVVAAAKRALYLVKMELVFEKREFRSVTVELEEDVVPALEQGRIPFEI